MLQNPENYPLDVAFCDQISQNYFSFSGCKRVSKELDSYGFIVWMKNIKGFGSLFSKNGKKVICSVHLLW